MLSPCAWRRLCCELIAPRLYRSPRFTASSRDNDSGPLEGAPEGTLPWNAPGALRRAARWSDRERARLRKCGNGHEEWAQRHEGGTKPLISHADPPDSFEIAGGACRFRIETASRIAKRGGSPELQKRLARPGTPQLRYMHVCMMSSGAIRLQGGNSIWSQPGIMRGFSLAAKHESKARIGIARGPRVTLPAGGEDGSDPAKAAGRR